MLILLSPAKNLNEVQAAGRATTVPRFLDQAEELHKVMLTWSEDQIADLMKVSPKIARLNAERISQWSRDSGAAQAAADMFDGDVYRHLEMATLGEDGRAEAALRLRILSGLYGLLRPGDDICPYRLEMGRKLPGHPAGTLYKFWGTKIADALVKDAATLQTDTILNLASDEYSKSVDRTALGGLRWVSPRFEEERQGRRKVIAFSAKRARGAMARWVLENRHTDPRELAQFEMGGYAFDTDTSTSECPVFVR
ncbi:YaaA family protein [Oceaniglobus ichthyenteri]|uniref:YaaA family protein n=1 Tax=Oceaniglobus ichthyenteri TaxID=2136177 RepID=UPI000D35EDA9|nr:YaaA family protein [Oceaniglobus ichthyenteri]